MCVSFDHFHYLFYFLYIAFYINILLDLVTSTNIHIYESHLRMIALLVIFEKFQIPNKQCISIIMSFA